MVGAEVPMVLGVSFSSQSVLLTPGDQLGEGERAQPLPRAQDMGGVVSCDAAVAHGLLLWRVW